MAMTDDRGYPDPRAAALAKALDEVHAAATMQIGANDLPLSRDRGAYAILKAVADLVLVSDQALRRRAATRLAATVLRYIAEAT